MTGVSTARNIYEGLESRPGEPTLVGLLGNLCVSPGRDLRWSLRFRALTRPARRDEI
jgi:hypothetical protein